MKSKIFGIVLLVLLSATANAKVLSVSRSSLLKPGEERALFEVTIEICRNGFPTVMDTVTKISNDAAKVELDVFSGACDDPKTGAAFLIDLDQKLKDVGLDPKTAKIFVQLQ